MGSAVQLTAYLSSDAIWLDVDVDDKDGLLRVAGERLAVGIDGCSGADIYELLLARERVASTGVGEGVAIPHATCAQLDTPRLAVLRLVAPIDFDAVDREKVGLVVTVLAPKGAQALHLRLLARIARLIRSERVREGLLAAKTADAAYSIIAELELSAAS
jgi:PTS system nitrogen regulatory IIA component